MELPVSHPRRAGLDIDRGTFLAYAAALAVAGCGAPTRQPKPPSAAPAPSADEAPPVATRDEVTPVETTAPAPPEPTAASEGIPVPASAVPAMTDAQTWRDTCEARLTAPSCESSHRVLPLCVGLNEVVVAEVGTAAMQCMKDLDHICDETIVEACVAPLAVKWAEKLAGREVGQCEALQAVIPGTKPWGMGSCTRLFSRTMRKHEALQNLDEQSDHRDWDFEDD